MKMLALEEYLLHWSHAVILAACIVGMWSLHCLRKDIRKLYTEMERWKVIREKEYGVELESVIRHDD